MSALPAHSDLRVRFEGLAEELIGCFDAWSGEDWSEGEFDRRSRQLFELQFEGNQPFRSYCVSRGVDPGSIGDWREIPPVPTEAFRHVDLRVLSSRNELCFLTSGTTRGSDARGRHFVPCPKLYSAALRQPFRRLVLGAGGVELLLVSLVPPYDPAGGSSLAWMLDDLIGSEGRPGSRSVASGEGIDWQLLSSLCLSAGRDGTSVCFLGTTLAFSAWLDELERESLWLQLPPGSLLMDTGGGKGLTRFDRTTVLSGLLPRIGLGENQVVNEFGMTELLSQRYGTGIGSPILVGPPWLRTLVLDPVGLEPVPAGTEGILCHVDLANAGSVQGILTEDRGRMEGEGIVWLGRTEGAPPRGCSLATAELLAQARDD